MDITSIDSTSLTIGVYPPLATTGVGVSGDPLAPTPVPNTDTSAPAADTAAAASVNISKPGQLFSKLKSLESSDPDQFKQVMTDVSNSLRTAAQQDGSTPDGQALSALADKFAQAASAGNLSPLQEAQGHHGHHGHHGGHGGHGGQGGQAGQAGAVGAYAGGSPAGASAFAAPVGAAGGTGGVADAVEQAISAALAQTTAPSSQA